MTGYFWGILLCHIYLMVSDGFWRAPAVLMVQVEQKDDVFSYKKNQLKYVSFFMLSLICIFPKVLNDSKVLTTPQRYLFWGSTQYYMIFVSHTILAIYHESYQCKICMSNTHNIYVECIKCIKVA